MLPAKDGQKAFLAAGHDADLKVIDAVAAVMWFKGCTKYLQANK